MGMADSLESVLAKQSERRTAPVEAGARIRRESEPVFVSGGVVKLMMTDSIAAGLEPQSMKSHSPAPPLNNSSSPTPPQPFRPLDVVFRDICVSKDGKQILKNVSGMVKPGEMLAVMGPSGSGKTTLLNAIAGRLAVDSGCTLVNGEILNKQLRRKICYVMQQDIFFPDLTLKQTLNYTAKLRLPQETSKMEREAHIDRILDTLDLRRCQNTIIGDVMKRGLSGGEKKRANIACELLTNPTIMLLDEPTSGLDSSTAHSLIVALKEYAQRENKTLIVTVHQPSSQIFYMFDKLLLLCNGHTAYYGAVSQVVDFFSRVGLHIQQHYNPSDFVLEQLKKSVDVQEKIIQAANELRQSPDYPKQLRDEVFRNNHHHHHRHHHHNSHRNNHHHNQHHPRIESPTQLSDCDEINGRHLEHSEESWKSLHHRHVHVDDEADDAVADIHGSPSRSPRHHSWCDESDIKSSTELRVMIDPDKKAPTVYSKIAIRDDEDSGRSSWSEAGSSVFGSDQSDWSGDLERNKWPTSFYTQVSVLTQRNFLEAKGRMLSKLNWVQTIGLGLICGLIWFQIDRNEHTVADLRGWMFFSTTYWMLFALFGALISFPPEREVINKERASGAYRLSAYYVAKMIGELPLTITLPSVFHFIAYPLLGMHNVGTFFSIWGYLIVSTIVSQSVGLFIGAACTDLQVSVTVSALYSLSTMLFGGYYATSIPSWLQWIRYLSMVHYAFQNMNIIEFRGGPPVKCALTNSKYPSCDNSNLYVPIDELLAEPNGSAPLPIWANTIVLFVFLVVFRLLGYLVLRYVHKPK